MLLEARAGSTLTVHASGPDAQAAAEALQRFMNESL